MSNWIYDAPPPAPPPTGTVRSGRGGSGANAGVRRGRGRGRGGIHGQATVFQPAMHLPTETSFTSPQTQILSSSADIKAPANTSEPRPTQYNDAGYALSSTYDANSGTRMPQASSKAPAPRIQGTNISLDTDQDIAAWIAERKKHWPTDVNVEKRKAEHKGQVTQRPKKRQRPNAIAEPVTGVAEDASQLPQVPSSSLDIALAALSGPFPDKEAPPEVPGTKEPTSNDVPASSSTSDSGSGADSHVATDESDAEAAPEAVSSKAAERVQERPAKSGKPCKYFRQGRCLHGESCTYSHAQDGRPVVRGASKVTHPTRVDDRYKWRKRKSLFDRLVENEIRHEQEAAALAPVQSETQTLEDDPRHLAHEDP